MPHMQDGIDSMKAASETAPAENSGIGGASSPQHLKETVEAVGELKRLCMWKKKSHFKWAPWGKRMNLNFCYHYCDNLLV